MKKNQTKRRLIVVAGVIVMLLGVIGSFYVYRKHRHRVEVAHWRSAGFDAEKSGNYAVAVDNLSNYLSAKPDDEEALRAYIDARPRVESPHLQHLTDTIRAMRYLLQLEPDLLEYRVKLLNLYRQLGMRTETLEAANLILKRDPANVSALESKTRILIDLKKNSEACETAKLWAAADPLSLSAQIAKMSCEFTNGQSSEDLLAEVDRWGTDHHDFPHHYELLKAVAYAIQGQKDNSLLWLRKAAQETAPDDNFVDLLVAEFTAQGDVAEDVSVLRSMVAHGAGERSRLLLLQRLWEISRYQEAAEIAAKMDLVKPGISATTLSLASQADSASGHQDKADSLKGLLARRTDPIAAAWVAILSATRNDVETSRALIDLCRKGITADPSNAYLHYYLGEALSAVGESDLAIESLTQAAQLNQTWSLPLVRLADLWLDKGNTDLAAQSAMTAMHRCPDPRTALAVARVAASINQTVSTANSDSLLRLIDEVEKASPGNGDAELIRLQVLAREGKKDQCKALIHSILEAKTPPSETLLLRIVDISRKHHLDADSDVLAADERLHGQTPTLTLNRAMDQLSGGHAPQGLELIDSAEQKAPQSQALEWQLVRARYLDMSGDPAAKAEWVRLAEQHPNELGVQTSALAARCLQGDRKHLEATITRMQGILGDKSLTCALARVRLLVATRAGEADDKEIADTLKGIITAHPEMPEPRILWARSLEHLGKTDEAVEQLEVAANTTPQNAEIALRLAELYRQKGDYERATQQLDRVLSLKSSSPGVVTAACRMLADQGEVNKAIKGLEQLGENAGEADKLTLADLYRRANQIDQANAIANELMQKPAPSPEVIDFVADLFAGEGQSSEAEAALLKLNDQKLAPGQKETIEGDYTAATGKMTEANDHYRSAIAQAPDNPAYRRNYIRALLASGNSAQAVAAANSAAQAIPADKSLSAIRDASQTLLTAAQTPEVHSLVLRYVQDPLNSPAVLDALDTIAKTKQSTDPLAAVSQAGSLSQRYPQLKDVQVWAIGIYLKAGKFKDAAAAISKAMQGFPESEEIARMATAFYRTQNRFDNMLDSATQWRKCSTHSDRPDIAIARALVGLNRPGEAIDRLQPYIAEARKDPDQQADLLIQYADALQAAGQTDQAAQLLLPLCVNAPRLRTQCLSLAAQNLDPKDGQAWIEQLAPSFTAISDMTMLANAWATLGARIGGRNSCTDKAHTLFQSIVARSDAPAQSIEQAATFAELTGDDPAAIALYRRTLSLDSNRSISANNLAAALLRTGGSLDQAADYARQAVTLTPSEPECLDTLASIKVKSGDYPAAIRCIEQAMQLQSENARWPVELAQLFVDSGQKSEAAKVIAGMDATGMDVNQLPPASRKQLDSLRSELNPAADLSSPATAASDKIIR